MLQYVANFQELQALYSLNKSTILPLHLFLQEESHVREAGLRGKLLNIMTQHLKGFEWHETVAVCPFVNTNFHGDKNYVKMSPISKHVAVSHCKPWVPLTITALFWVIWDACQLIWMPSFLNLFFCGLRREYTNLSCPDLHISFHLRSVQSL